MKYYVQAIYKDNSLGIASGGSMIIELKTLKGVINRVKRSVLLKQKNVVGFQVTRFSFRDNMSILYKEVL